MVTTVPGIHWIAVWSLHVLIVPMWMLSMYSGSLPQSKDRHVKSVCVSRVIDWRPVSVVPHVSIQQFKWAAVQHPRSGNERVSSVLLCLGMTVNLCQLFSLLCNTHSSTALLRSSRFYTLCGLNRVFSGMADLLSSHMPCICYLHNACSHEVSLRNWRSMLLHGQWSQSMNAVLKSNWLLRCILPLPVYLLHTPIVNKLTLFGIMCFVGIQITPL